MNPIVTGASFVMVADFIGQPLRMAFTLPLLMGYRFALFSYTTKTTGGFVDLDYFRVSSQIAGTTGDAAGERPSR